MRPRRIAGLAVLVAVVSALAMLGSTGSRTIAGPPSLPSSEGSLPAAPFSADSSGAPTAIFPLLQPSWVNVTSSIGSSPPGLEGASLAFDAADNVTVLFGGASSLAFGTNETWLFGDGHWTNVTDPFDAPPARVDASMDYDPNMGGVLLFGGDSSHGLLGDTWLYSAGRWTNLTFVSVAPPAREGGMMTFDPQPDENGSVLFGGYETGGSSNDTWIWEGWSGWVRANSSLAPPGVEFGGLVFDPASGSLVLFGGSSVCGFLCVKVESETWEFYSGEWWPASIPTNPGAREAFFMTYASSVGGILLFGGYSGTSYLSDTWKFTGGAWTELSPISSPSARSEPSFDPGAGPYAPVLYGGDGAGGVQNDTWVYEIAPGVSLSGPSTAEIGAPVSFDLSVDRGSAPYNATVDFGDNARQAVSLGGPSVSVLHAYEAPGTYSVSVNLTDAVGFTVGLSSALNITIVAGPTVSAHASPGLTDVGHSLKLSASGTSSSSLSYAWSFGDGSNGTGANVTHDYTIAGTFDATVTATDESGASANASVLISVNPLPTLSPIGSGPSPLAGSPDAFLVNVSGGSAPFTYAWSFGDGGSSTFAGPSHTFAAVGTYTVGVWVNDTVGGSAHASLEVKVGAASSSPTTSRSSTPAIPTWFWIGVAALGVLAVVLIALALRRPPAARSP